MNGAVAPARPAPDTVGVGERVRPRWSVAAASRGNRRPRIAWVAALGLTGALGLACGPSFQAVYECDVRFEHCYALDQGSASNDVKKECWREWLHAYTYGQSRDRVEYAAQRFSELSIGSTLPSIDVPEHDPDRAKRASAGPLPTSAFVPPPNVAERAPSAESSSPTAPAPPASAAVSSRTAAGEGAPGAACESRCLERWNGCKDGCKGPTCEHCDRAYRACVPACFR